MSTELGFFPDGTPVDPWFADLTVPTLADLGKQYIVTHHGIYDDGRVYTKEFQSLIDTAAENGGGVIVIPPGVYMTGAIHFKQGVNLYVMRGGVLRGSDDLRDYPLTTTRIEGQTCRYFPGLINVDGVNGFVMTGEGTIDGNGNRVWSSFWLRRDWNPDCTNKDEQRPRLVFMSNCKNVIVSGLNIQNAQFWTNHLYKCDHVKYLNCFIYSPGKPLNACSADAIDLDVCSDVLVKNCHMEVNDDAVVLKGGKGAWADVAPENGENERIIVEDCEYGFVHGCLVFGSECVHSRNIILRRVHVSTGYNLLWLKMRPDTPQHYEHILVEDITGTIANFLNVNPWRQFFDLQGRTDMPVSLADHVTVKNCTCDCDTFFNVAPDESQYHMSDFTLENIDVTAMNIEYDPSVIENGVFENITLHQSTEQKYNDAVTTL